MRNFLRTAAVVLVLTGLTACSTWTLPDQRGRLVSNVQDFTQRLRWKDINGAAEYFEKDPGERFRELFADSDDLHIVNVQVERVDIPQPGSATVDFEYQYYELPSVTVRTLRVEQEWILQRHGGRGRPGEWKIASDFPDPFQVQ